MLVRDEDVFMALIFAPHPSLKGVCGSTVKNDEHRKWYPKVGNWKYTLSGKTELLPSGRRETPIETAYRESREEGWEIPRGAHVYEVFRGTKKFDFLEKEHKLIAYFFFSIVVIDQPLIPMTTWEEQNIGVTQSQLFVDELAKLWYSGDNTTTVLNLCKRVSNGEKNIKPINQDKYGKWYY